MRDVPDHPPDADLLPAVYRFALLVTGSDAAASGVLQSVAEQAARGAADGARPTRRTAFAHARALCARLAPAKPAPPPVPPAETDGPGAAPDPSLALAQLFTALPEPERCALALFYLYQFKPDELAETLGLKPDDLGPLLLRARERLKAEGVSKAEVGSRKSEEEPTTPALS